MVTTIEKKNFSFRPPVGPKGAWDKVSQLYFMKFREIGLWKWRKSHFYAETAIFPIVGLLTPITWGDPTRCIFQLAFGEEMVQIGWNRRPVKIPPRELNGTTRQTLTTISVKWFKVMETFDAFFLFPPWGLLVAASLDF